MGTSGWVFSCKDEVLLVFFDAVLLSTLQDLKVSAIYKKNFFNELDEYFVFGGYKTEV